MTFSIILAHVLVAVLFAGIGVVVGKLFIGDPKPNDDSFLRSFGSSIFCFSVAGLVLIKLLWSLLDILIVWVSKLIGA